MSTSNQSSKMEQQKQHQHQQQNQNKRKFPSDASASDDSMATPAEMKQLMLDSVQSNVSFRDIKMKRRKLPAAMYTSDGESVCSSSEGSFTGSSASSSSDSPSALLPTSRSGTTDSRGSMAEGSVSSCSPGVQNSSEDDGSPKGSNEGDCGGGGGSGYEGRSENDEQGDMESRVDSSQERMLNSIDHRRSEEQQNLNYQRPLKVCTSEYGESWDYVTNRDSAANRAREMMTHAQYSPRQHPYLLYSSYQHSPLIPNHTQSAYNMVYNERQPSYSIPSNTYNITTTSTEVYNNYRYAQTSDSEQCAGLDYSAKTLTAQANLQKISPYSLSHSYPSPTTVGYNRSSQFQPYWPPGYQPDYSPRSNGVTKALRSPRSETSGSDKCNSDTSYSNCTKESYSYPETGRSIEQGLTPTSIKVNTSNNDSLLMYSNKNHQEHYNAVVTRKDSNFITALRPQSPCRTNSRVVGDSGHVTNDNYSTDKHEHTTTQRPQSVDSSSAQQSRMSAPLSTVVTTTKAQMTSTAAANTAAPSNDDNNSDMVTSAVTAPSSCGGNEQTGPSKQGLKLAYVQITPSVLAPVWLPEEAKTMGSPTMSQMPALGTQLVPMVGKVKTEGGREKVITFPTLGAPPSSSGSPIQISIDEVLPPPTNKHHHQKNCGISPGSKPGGDSADLTYPVVHLHERVPPPWMPELWEQRKIKKEEGNGDSAVSAPPGHTINWQQLVQLKDCQKALIQQWAEQEKKVKDLGESGDSEPGLSCEICQDRASGLHYGIITCEGCKGFFKRTVQNRRTYTCVGTGTCEVTKAQRNRCQYCRFRKCLDKGMILAAVREDRSPGGRSSGAVYNMYKGKYRRRLAGSSRASSAGSDTASVADSEDSNTSSNNNMMAPVVMPPPPAVQQAPNHPIFSRQFSLPTPQNNPLGQQQQQQKQQQQQQQSQLGAILTSQPVEVKIKQEVSWQSPPSLLLSSPNERINGMMRMTALGTMQGCGNVGSDSGASFQVPKNVMPSSSSSCTYRAPEGMSVAASSQVSPRDSGDVDSRLHELNTQRNSNQQSQGSGGTSIDKHNHQDSENLQYRNDSSSSQSQVRQQQQQQQQAQHNLSTSQPSWQQQQPDQEPHRTQASFAFSSSNQSSGGQNCHLVSSDNKPTAESGKILAKYSKEPLPGASLSVVSELLTTDSIIKSLTSVQRSMTLLSNLSDLTYTMCALSDDIVAHLAAWMKALPFYSDIPLAASSDVLSNSWCSMLLLVTCLAKAQSHMATDSRSKCVLLDTPVSSPGPAVPGDVEDPAADVCLDTVDIKEMEQDSPPSNRGEFYELLRLNMKFLHEHMMGVMQRTLQFGELYDAMGMMTERVTHIVHKMITLGITPSEAACLKVILLLHQDSSKKHNEVSQIQRYYIWVLKAHLQDSESHPSQTPPPQTPTPAGSEENKTTTASSGFKMPQDNRTPSPGMASPLTQAAQSKLQRARQHQRHRIVELIKLLRFTKVVAEVLVKNKLLYLPILLNATGSVDAGGSVVGKKEPS